MFILTILQVESKLYNKGSIGTGKVAQRILRYELHGGSSNALTDQK
jgi:hypothetical protein